MRLEIPEEGLKKLGENYKQAKHDVWTLKRLGHVDMTYAEFTCENRHYFPIQIWDNIEKLLCSKKQGFQIYCEWCGNTVPRFRITRSGHIQHHYESCAKRIAKNDKEFMERRGV